MNSCFLSTLGNRYTGPEWFSSMIAKGGAKFTDPAFIGRTDRDPAPVYRNQDLQCGLQRLTNEGAREYFIAGRAASFIGGNWDESRC